MRRLLLLAVELGEHRLHAADDERKRHEEQGEQDAGRREDDLQAVVLEPPADDGARPVEGDQHDSGH